MLQRRLLVTGIALLLSFLTYICTIVLIQPSIAPAHAYVIGSDPVDGSTVVQVPKEVHIYWLKTIGPDIWFGSFAYLGYVLLPLLKTKNRSYDTEALATLLQRLTPVVGASVSIQLLSLVFLSDASIHNPQLLSTDPYGLTLAVQWIMIVITALLSTYILFVLHPRIVHTATVSVLGMGILLCSALMSFYAPPIVFPNVAYTNQSDILSNAVKTQIKQIGPFSVTLELLPGHIDHPNTVTLHRD